MAKANQDKERALSLALLRSCLAYDPDTGVFTRLKTDNPNPAAVVGGVAGHVQPHGYRHIRVGDHRYLAHRLAWFYVYGVWPADEIDHINRDRDDNRISNLRLVDRLLNNWGRVAAPMQRRDGYIVRLVRNGKTVIRKQFPTLELAKAMKEIALAQFNALNPSLLTGGKIG